MTAKVLLCLSLNRLVIPHLVSLSLFPRVYFGLTSCLTCCEPEVLHEGSEDVQRLILF